jgi:uncharacterized membrane protein YcaP (DUF421 family)
MQSVLHDMFVLGLPVAEKVLRPLVVYFFLGISLRLAGKHQLAQLNPFDLVVLLTLSNTVQNAIIGEDNSVTGGLIGAATLLIVNYIVVRFLFSHERLDHLVEGDPDALIEGGLLREDRMKKELLTKTELESAAHRQGFASLDEIEKAVLEPGGTLYFVGKKSSKEQIGQSELRSRLDTISRQLSHLQRSLDRPAQPGGSGS